MKKAFPVFAVVASALLAGQALCADIDKVGGFEVAEVVVKTGGGASVARPEDYVLTHISAAKGGFITQADIARDQRELLNTGSFSDVRILVENVGDKVRVIYEVAIAPRFKGPLVIKGNDEISNRSIRNIFSFGPGDVVTQARLDTMCDKLRDEYRDDYYCSPVITATIGETDENGLASVTVEIEEGTRSRIDDFEFSGNKVFKASELRGDLGHPSWYNPFGCLMNAWRKQALDFEFVRDTISEKYRNEGYLDVNVSEPVLKYPGDDTSKAPVMAVAIDEGNQYRVASVKVEGATLFPAAEFEAIAQAFLPSAGVASSKAIADFRKAVADYYGARGYVDTFVTVSSSPADAPSAGAEFQDCSFINIKASVEEGYLATVRSISIRGNTYTKDKVVRREIMIAPGQVFNEPAAEHSRKRIENLTFFESARFYELPSREDKTQRDVVYEVTEGSTGNLLVGFGTSSLDDVVGYLDISHNNFDIGNWSSFRGAGQRARLTASVGSGSSDVDISWTDPWFLDRRQSLTVDLYRREIGYSEYDETRIGAAVSYTVPLTYGRGTIRIGVENVASDDIIKGNYSLFDDPSQTFSYEDLINDSYLRIPLRLSWLYDTRDHPYIPHSGSRNTVFAEIQSSSLGSEYDIYRLGFDLRQYIPLWFGHVISLRLRGETLDSFGDTDELPPNEKLYLGGSRSVRGYRVRDVGPKAIPDEETGGRAHPVGGKTLAQFTAEYTVPITDMLRFAVFYDTGNVWSDAFDADFGELASDWGLGVRLDFPGFPVRLDYAFPIEGDDDYSRKDHFIFWIGFE